MRPAQNQTHAASLARRPQGRSAQHRSREGGVGPGDDCTRGGPEFLPSCPAASYSRHTQTPITGQGKHAELSGALTWESSNSSASLLKPKRAILLEDYNRTQCLQRLVHSVWSLSQTQRCRKTRATLTAQHTGTNPTPRERRAQQQGPQRLQEAQGRKENILQRRTQENRDHREGTLKKENQTEVPELNKLSGRQDHWTEERAAEAPRCRQGAGRSGAAGPVRPGAARPGAGRTTARPSPGDARPRGPVTPSGLHSPQRGCKVFSKTVLRNEVSTGKG